MARNAHKRYSEIMKDVEDLISDHIRQQKADHRIPSKLKLLVPSVGTFFTPLPLQEAFRFQDERRYISSRRFVAPSFNDIRLVLNTAQAMSLIRGSRLELVTFVRIRLQCYYDTVSMLGEIVANDVSRTETSPSTTTATCYEKITHASLEYSTCYEAVPE